MGRVGLIPALLLRMNRVQGVKRGTEEVLFKGVHLALDPGCGVSSWAPTQQFRITILRFKALFRIRRSFVLLTLRNGVLYAVPVTGRSRISLYFSPFCLILDGSVIDTVGRMHVGSGASVPCMAAFSATQLDYWIAPLRER